MPSHAVTYNVFNQPSQITDVSATLDKQRLELDYGADQQRNQVSRYKNNSWENRRDYVSQYYEYEIAKGSPNVIRHYHYIYGDDDVVALHIAESNVRNETMYYIHTDHLGSYCALTDPQKQVRQRNYFDAWGNSIKQFRRTNSRDSLVVSTEEPSGVEDSTLNFTLTARGFTGHEHYPDFKIINMNGRLYDPVIGRFFSPDNFVMDHTFTQDFNRYSYARNCPLMYTDPTGQMISPYFDKNGNLLGTDEKGWKGDIYITTQAVWDNLQKDKNGRVNSQEIQAFSTTRPYNTEFSNQYPTLTSEAESKIATTILQKMEGENFSKLYNGEVSILKGTANNGTIGVGYNDPNPLTDRLQFDKTANGQYRITAKSGELKSLGTVEAVWNYLGIHEYKGHGTKGIGPGRIEEQKAYRLQYEHPTYKYLSPGQQKEIRNRMNGIW